MNLHFLGNLNKQVLETIQMNVEMWYCFKGNIYHFTWNVDTFHWISRGYIVLFSFLKSFYSLWVRKKEASIGLFDVQWWNITLKYEDSSLMYMLTLYSVTLKNLWGSRKQWIYAAFILFWILWISSYIIGSCDWIISMATLCHREFVRLWLVRLRRL